MRGNRLFVVGVVVAAAIAGLMLTGCQANDATLQGRLTVSAGTAAQGVAVTVYSDASADAVASTTTDVQGDWGFKGTVLPAGTYRIRFGADGWWQDASSWISATPVVVDGTDPTEVDATIASGSISGTVQGPSGLLAGVTVTATNTVTGSVALTATSESDGTYVLANIPVGTYHVRFSAVGYTSRYSSSAVRSTDAPTITVSDGTTVSGVDTTLATESTISGTVEVVQGVSGAIVAAIDPSSGEVLSQTASDSAGHFELGGLDDVPVVIEVVRDGFLPAVWGSPDGQITSGTPVTPPSGSGVTLGEPIDLIGGSCTPSIIEGGDLAGANLQNCDLTGADLTGDDLTGANLTGATLTDATLTNATFTNAALDYARSGGIVGNPTSLPNYWDLVDGYLIGSHANLAGADLSGANLTDTDPESANLTGANLSGANFTRAYLDSSNLSGANLQGTYLGLAYTYFVSSGGVTGTPASLPSGWKLVHGYLVGDRSDLVGAALDGADLSGMNLWNSNMDDATLTNTNFTGTTLTGVDFSGADLAGANFTNADLSNADFGNVNAAGTILDGATMKGVSSGGVTGAPASLPDGWQVVGGYLAGPYATLESADLDGLNLSGADLDHVSFLGAELTDTNLTGADLTGADFSSAYHWPYQSTELIGTDFSDADLSQARFNGANITGAIFSGATLDRVRSGVVTGVPASLPSSWAVRAGHLVGPDADLTGATLTGADLSGLDLSAVDLTGATLAGADIDASNLADAIFTSIRSGGVTGTPTALPASWQLMSGFLVGPGVDLSDMDLSGLDLSGAIITGADLTNVNLTGTNLTGTDLTNGDLTRADLTSADLTNADLTGTNLTGADLTNGGLTGVTSSGVTGSPSALPTSWQLINGYLVGPGANLAGANLQSASLIDASLAGADLSHATMHGATLTDADLHGANLSDADLSYANLGSSNLAETKLDGTNLRNTNLDGADLSNATLPGVKSGSISGTPTGLPSPWIFRGGYLLGPRADLSGTSHLASSGLNLSYMDLRGANLSGVQFTNVDFIRTDLTGADLSSAGFYGAQLAAANFTDTNLAGILVRTITGTPTELPTSWQIINGYLVGPSARLAYADLEDADLSGLDLSGADFLTTDLIDADLANTDLSGASFQGTKVDGTVFTNADFTGVTSSGLIGTPAALPSGWSIAGGVFVHD